MKIVDKYKCKGKETMLASEVAILRQVCHPNIISLVAEQETTDQLFLVMELVKVCLPNNILHFKCHKFKVNNKNFIT